VIIPGADTNARHTVKDTQGARGEEKVYFDHRRAEFVNLSLP